MSWKISAKENVGAVHAGPVLDATDETLSDAVAEQVTQPADLGDVLVRDDDVLVSGVVEEASGPAPEPAYLLGDVGGEVLAEACELGLGVDEVELVVQPASPLPSAPGRGRPPAAAFS